MLSVTLNKNISSYRLSQRKSESRQFSFKHRFSTYNKFKDFKKATMVNFVQNKGKQQEKLLIIYTFLVLSIILYLLQFQPEASVATLSLLSILLLLYSFGYALVSYISLLPQRYKDISLLFLFCGVAYLGFYISALLILGVTLRSVFKEKPKTPQEGIKKRTHFTSNLLKGSRL